MAGWYESIMESLQFKYDLDLVKPTSEDPQIAFGAQYNDYWSADAVAIIVPQELGGCAQRDSRGPGAMGAQGWTDGQTFKLADTAYHLAKVIKQKGINNYDAVVRQYIHCVANSSAPDFFDRIPEFQRAVFTTREGQPITGAVLLKEATKGRFPSPGTRNRAEED